jgi:PAS domain S-box-containing protein
MTRLFEASTVINRVQPTQIENLMRDEDFIVSKTDLNGRITYCNRIFREFSGYTEKQLIGAAHNIIRHPDMPRGLFKFIWNELAKEQEVLVYMKNLAANGSFYWVFATMSPSYNSSGQVVGYFSARRAPKRDGIKIMEEIYRRMLAEESRVERSAQPDVSLKMLNQLLAEKGVTYEKFILSL